jgi:hypothetical protein
MLASDFARDDCLVGRKRRTYATLVREYVCNECGGRLDTQWSEDTDQYPKHWYIRCSVCGGQDFIHECELLRQEDAAANVIPALAAYLPAGFIKEKREPVLDRILSADPELVEL